MRRFFALSCLLPILAACGGPQPPAPAEAPSAAPDAPPAAEPAPAPADAPAAETPAAPPAAKVAWKDMNKDQRIEHMKNVVLPKMKESFAAFDAKEFGAMNCATCHGEGAKEGSFKMPNPKLPKLSMAGGFKKHMDKEPAATKFMMEKVVPDMAGLLDTQPFDPKTNQGFACGNCHTIDK